MGRNTFPLRRSTTRRDTSRPSGRWWRSRDGRGRAAATSCGSRSPRRGGGSTDSAESPAWALPIPEWKTSTNFSRRPRRRSACSGTWLRRRSYRRLPPTGRVRRCRWELTRPSGGRDWSRPRSANEAVELARVLADDLTADVGSQVTELTLDELARVGPDAVGMGEVRAPHDVVDADLVEQLDADAIRLVGRLALAAPVLTRREAEAEVLELVLPFRIHPIEDVRDPADPALADDDLHVRVPFEDAPVDERHEDVRHVDLEAGDVDGARDLREERRQLRQVGHRAAD